MARLRGSDIVDETLTGSDIQDGTIVTDDLAANAVTGAKARLENNEALRARNAADSADVDLLKLNSSDKFVAVTDLHPAVNDTLALGDSVSGLRWTEVVTKKVTTSNTFALVLDGVNIDVVGNEILNVATPSAGSSAANKDYADGLIANIPNSALADMAQSTIKGRAVSAGTGDPTDLSAAQATEILDVVVGDSGAGGTKGLVPAPGAGDAAAGKFLKADGTFAVPAASGISELTGDVTAGPGTGSQATTVANDVITNAKLANMAASTFKARVTGSTGDPEDITGTQATTLLDAFTSALKGLAPASGGGTTNFLRADGTWNAPSGGGSSLVRGHLAGLVLSNNTTDASNDLDISAGEAIDSTNAFNIALGSSITKQLDAAWAVGTNQGGLDTGSEASSTWYHVWLIKRSDTSVVDVLFSVSATAPTMPTNYDQKRRIGSFFNNGSSIIEPFFQLNDTFQFKTEIHDVTTTNPGTSAVLRTLTVPLGVVTEAIFNVRQSGGTLVNSRAMFTCPDTVDEAIDNHNANHGIDTPGSANSQQFGEKRVFTNTSSQIRSRSEQSSATTALTIGTRGWTDSRGRFN